MKKWALILSIIMLLGVMLSACSDAANSSVPSSQPTTGNEPSGAIVEAKELDVLKIGVADLPKNMDPTLSVGNTTIRVHYNTFETLILADQNDNYAQKPMLAEEWKRIDDYTVEFTLRKGVKFHDGSELTTKDVKFSFDRLNKELDGVELARSLMAVIKDVEIIDDYKFRVISNVVDPILEDRLASSWGSWILPADYINKVGDEEFSLHPVGTGPFKIVSFSPEKVVLERFDEYWGEKPNVKRVEYIFYPETSARVTALITGEVDIITQLPVDQVEVIKNSKGLNVESVNITNMHMLRYYTDRGPLKDKKLRQALNLAIDRQLLSDTLWGGQAIVPKGHQYPEFGDMYFSDYAVAEYNLEKAKQLVEESSYNGEVITYELESGQYTLGNEVAEVIVDMWSKIGVTAKVVFKDKADDDSMTRNWSNSMRFPDPSGGLWLLWGSVNGKPIKHWLDMPKNFQDAGEELISIIDPARRKVLARELMDIFVEEAPGTVLYYPLENWGVRDGIQWKPYASQTMDFRAGNFKVN